MADTDIKLVERETIALLDKDSLFSALSSFKATTTEREIAAEYVKAYAFFLKDIAETDTKRGLKRADYEIRELVGHINAMLKQKQPDIFMKMLMMCPKHYAVLMKAAEPAAEKN